MLLITGTIRLPVANMGIARPLMHDMVVQSRAEEGCIEYVYAEDLFEPGLVHVKERWANHESLERHFSSAHLARWRASWAQYEIGERNLKLYEVGEAKPI